MQRIGTTRLVWMLPEKTLGSPNSRGSGLGLAYRSSNDGDDPDMRDHSSTSLMDDFSVDSTSRRSLADGTSFVRVASEVLSNSRNLYDVYFDTVNPPTTLIASNLILATYNPGVLANNTTYYWQIESPQ